MRTVLGAREPAEAYRARDLLRENGIAAEVSWETRTRGAVLPLDLEPSAEVWIADEARAGEARALLAELEERGPGGPPWTCACGAANDGVFDALPDLRGVKLTLIWGHPFASCASRISAANRSLCLSVSSAESRSL